ncbi:neuronal acetylcholine receptor subunit alpha-2-like [Convolutriloba macropyga]|uniref:neuronal acetylcholine receptor subunit alpha-2-like n=1 Tax=Convolutriloba macropyga TaxID=536237 RepID=UPI003F51D983
MKTKVWLVRVWVDEYLQWNPADYNNITDIRVESDQIWIPDLVVTNAEYFSRGICLELITN